ncbi:MAG: hypothetical protein ABIG89_05565 [Candidatus Woesearchaeota archaeon]
MVMDRDIKDGTTQDVGNLDVALEQFDYSIRKLELRRLEILDEFRGKDYVRALLREADEKAKSEELALKNEGDNLKCELAFSWKKSYLDYIQAIAGILADRDRLFQADASGKLEVKTDLAKIDRLELDITDLDNAMRGRHETSAPYRVLESGRQKIVDELAELKAKYEPFDVSDIVMDLEFSPTIDPTKNINQKYRIGITIPYQKPVDNKSTNLFSKLSDVIDAAFSGIQSQFHIEDVISTTDSVKGYHDYTLTLDSSQYTLAQANYIREQVTCNIQTNLPDIFRLLGITFTFQPSAYDRRVLGERLNIAEEIVYEAEKESAVDDGR